jgi:hypothetical protein
MTLYCPRCGQRVLRRLGVMLSPRQADVFDMIQRQGKYGGIRIDTLADVFGKSVVKVHVCAINKLLATNGWQIVCKREGSAKGFYLIRKIKRDKRDIEPDLLTGLKCALTSA